MFVDVLLGRGPVSKVGGDDELPLLSLAHAEQPLVPALDHAPRTQREGEGFACTHRNLLVPEKGLHWSLLRASLFDEREF